MKTQNLILTQHTEHNEWLNKLLFYKDDLIIMQNRLDEITKKNTSTAVMKSIEHFQNQFIIQREQIDILKHDINIHEDAIKKTINENPIASDHRRTDDHKDHRQKIERFEELFALLRKDLMSFLAKWM